VLVEGALAGDELELLDASDLGEASDFSLVLGFAAESDLVLESLVLALSGFFDPYKSEYQPPPFK
jgi:hypothetical protein